MEEVIHITDFRGTKRVKMCDGTPQTEPKEDGSERVVCAECRRVFRGRS